MTKIKVAGTFVFALSITLIILFSYISNQNNINNYPEDMLVGVGPKGVIINDIERTELESIPFSNIASWGINNSIVVIVFESKGELLKYYFETPQVNLN